MTRPTEQGHWYTRAGAPAYTVIGANGKERNTTVRDARKLGLVPSVTGIINEANSYGKVHYQIEQGILAALTLPRHPDESESLWIERVWADSREAARKAAAGGTAIHAAIQGALEGGPFDPQYGQHVDSVFGILSADPLLRACDRFNVENFFCHIALGYGGKVDIHNESIVVDIKTKEFSLGAKLTTYDEHAMQLSAYREGLRLPHATCGIIYVSRTVPGLARLIWIDQKELVRGWHMFTALLRYWQHKNKYVWEPE